MAIWRRIEIYNLISIWWYVCMIHLDWVKSDIFEWQSCPSTVLKMAKKVVRCD